jgi:uncharacterized membrane protein (DUF4010 family)
MTALALTPLELAARLALALGLAVFLGLAFEEVYKSEQRSIPGGIRSFPMLAMAGAVLTLIEPAHALAFLAGLVVVALWLYAFLRAAPVTAETASMMIPASNLLAYAIGPLALLEPPWVAVAVAVVAVLLLSSRARLHRLTRMVPRDELLTLGKFLILVGIALPLVPDKPVTALTRLTPYDIWLAVIAVCTLSYASYLLQRYLPARNMALLPAVLGGAYSSTATTVVLAKRLRESGQARADISAGILCATAVMYLRLSAVIALFDVRLALMLAPALAALAIIAAGLAVNEWRRLPKRRSAGLAMAPRNPLQIATAVIFAVLLVVISVVTAWVRGAFGTAGILTLSAVVGVTDIDPYVLNIAQGGVTGMPLDMLGAAVLVAAASNNVVKAAYAAGFGGLTAARRPALMLLLLALAGLAAAAFYAVGAAPL